MFNNNQNKFINLRKEEIFSPSFSKNQVYIQAKPANNKTNNTFNNILYEKQKLKSKSVQNSYDDGEDEEGDFWNDVESDDFDNGQNNENK